MPDPIRDLVDKIGEQIPDRERVALDLGNEHPFTCKCGVCKRWWHAMGPQDVEPAYGPFTLEEIEDGSEAGDRCKEQRLEFKLTR